MKFTLTPINPRKYEGNIVVLNGIDGADRWLPLHRKEIDYLGYQRADKPQGVVAFDRLPYRIYVVNFDPDKGTGDSHEQLRLCAAEVVKMLKAEKQTTVAVTGEGIIPEEVIAFVEGLVLADYTFDRYKSKTPNHIEEVTIDALYLTQEELDRNQSLWNRIFWCREWVNLPVADFNAEEFASELQDIANDLQVTCTVFDKKQIESLQMGGLIAVNKGSVDEPRFVVLEYKPVDAYNSRPLALVGKGVMYDTGGLNIKPDDYMQEMKSDMAGAATMASALFAVADNHLPIHVVAFLPLTDSRPGFNAYAADDVLTMYDGTTVEVVNTDAEGRLILADAIAYAVANYNPELVIDAATLTGAAVRAIGTYGIAAMHQGAEEPFRLLSFLGQQLYERIAEFPFWPEYGKMLESQVADLKHCGNAQAGTITAGKFLAHFAKETPYIHLDIAGVAYFSKPQQYYAHGASGYGIRLLYAFMQTFEALCKHDNKQ